jgi:hypothetical protein
MTKLPEAQLAGDMPVDNPDVPKANKAFVPLGWQHRQS